MPEIQVAGDLSALDQALEATPNRPAVFLIWPKEGNTYLG